MMRLFEDSWRWVTVIAMLISAANMTHAADHEVVAGADISMLPEIETAGGIYREDGKPTDALKILRDHHCSLFRVRLFVDPSTNFNQSYGATQDLKYVRALARRIKSAGGDLLLDFHYSDTWADPSKQTKPAAWKDLDFDALQAKVTDYTTSVIKDLQSNDAAPDMVQIGNEITGGVLWPDGKVLDAPADQEQAQWKRFALLESAAAKGVRAAQTPDHPIRIVLHIHGGGKPGLPKWFFQKFNQNPVDYDIIGLSFYPAWDDSLDALKQNMNDVITLCGKDVLIAETSYPSRPIDGMPNKPALSWPQTPEGQRQFLKDLIAAIDAAPDHHGLGFVWWYPEAIPTPPLQIWRNGAEGLFDRDGNALPALELFGSREAQ